VTATQIDPKTLAEALNLEDTFALAGVLRRWAAEQIQWLGKSIPEDFVSYDRLAKFDERVALARKHLEAAVAAEQSWNEDNPLDATDDD
jgi:hypothetical protein